jgi:hypothetical protein
MSEKKRERSSEFSTDSLNKNKRGKKRKTQPPQKQKGIQKKGERHSLNKNKKQIKKKKDTASKRIKGRVQFQQSCRKKHRTQSIQFHRCCG